MKIIVDTKDRLVIRHWMPVLAGLCGLFLIGGLYFSWKVISGAADDYFGMFIGLALPIVMLVWFLPVTELKLSRSAGTITLARYRPFGLTRIETFTLSDLQGVGHRRLRGHNSKGQQIFLNIDGTNTGLTYGASQMVKIANFDDVVDKIRSFANVGDLPPSERHPLMDLPIGDPNK